MSNAKGAKSLRIEQVEVAMKNDRIRLSAGMEGFDELVRELLSFGNSRHDDYMDALSQCVAANTGVMTQKIPSERTAMDDIRRWMFESSKEPEGDSSNPSGSNGPCM